MNTKLSDAELRQRYQELLRARANDDRTQISLDRMLALIERRGSEAERLETLDAVMADEASAREFELLRSITSATARPIPYTRRLWLAAAAALVLVAVPIGRNALRQPEVELMRDASLAAVLTSPAEVASATDSRTFRWRAVVGAQSYRMEILTAAGTPVFTTRTLETTVTLPRDVVIAPNVEHRWWVYADFADGTQRTSAFRRLIVRDVR